MSERKRPPKIDIPHAAQMAEHFSGLDLLSNFERLKQDTQAPQANYPLSWEARFECRTDVSGVQQFWLYLQVAVTVAQVCQRCLQPVAVDLQIDRAFRFVVSEAQALEQDEDSEEDLLVVSRVFDLEALIEDEVLMGLPLVPRHETCPVQIKSSCSDANFEKSSERPSPFAVLSRLRTPDQ